jgi:signal transduction histidine kinase
MRPNGLPRKPLCILHLEDNANDAELVRLTLERSGISCRVIRAATQAEFAAALQQNQLDLVLADFSLPGFDGMAALRLTRQIAATVPFILVSGTVGEERAVESLKNGATDYVLKERLFRLGPAVQRAMQEVEHQVARQQAEAAREETNRKLQVLSRRLVETQETERRHIARELHDEIGQTLTLAQLNLQAVLAQPETTAAQPRLQECLAAVERVLEQVHDISLNLRPSLLDDLGLEPALRWYTNRQAGLVGLKAEFVAAPLPRRLDPRLETECFRIAQEALTNVVRHAQAKSVKVTLKHRQDRLELRVRDDGVGFDVAAGRERAVRGSSLGLLSMEERAALLGGGLEIKSAPGHGAEIHAWLPLRWQTESSDLPAHD